MEYPDKRIMIPTFPDFKNIEWTDRTEVEQFTKEFPPYSDFNFVSLWSWNTSENMQLSNLNGNLVALFHDYVTESPFLSYIGTNALSDTAHLLIEYSQCKLQEPSLKLVPEAVAANLPGTEFTILSDEASHDYILSIAYLSSLDTLPSTHQAARYCKKYMQFYPHHTAHICPMGDARKDDYICLFKEWAKIKCLDHLELNEYGAFERFMENCDNGNMFVSLYDGSAMIGFATYEIIAPEYAIVHFTKANHRYAGVYEQLNFILSKKLKEHGIRFLNYEQDLGIPALRKSKLKFKPVTYLKKCIVTKKN